MYAAVDIGGTKTLLAVFDEGGAVAEQVKFPTPPKYNDFLAQLADSVANLSTKEFKFVGAAAPGVIDHKEGLLIAAGNLAWRHKTIQADFEEIFKAPVRLENDAKAAALAESRAVGVNYETVVYITISTGIGVGVCVNGNLDHTLQDSEPGKMKIENGDQMVEWESIASGKAIVAKYGKRASDLDDEAAWHDIAHNIAKGLLAVIAIVQPDLIVFGGGVGSNFEKFRGPLLKELEKYENPLAPTPPLRIATHPEEAVIYGCYELAKDSAKH